MSSSSPTKAFTIRDALRLGESYKVGNTKSVRFSPVSTNKMERATRSNLYDGNKSAELGNVFVLHSGNLQSFTISEEARLKSKYMAENIESPAPIPTLSANNTEVHAHNISQVVNLLTGTRAMTELASPPLVASPPHSPRSTTTGGRHEKVVMNYQVCQGLEVLESVLHSDKVVWTDSSSSYSPLALHAASIRDELEMELKIEALQNELRCLMEEKKNIKYAERSGRRRVQEEVLAQAERDREQTERDAMDDEDMLPAILKAQQDVKIREERAASRLDAKLRAKAREEEKRVRARRTEQFKLQLALKEAELAKLKELQKEEALRKKNNVRAAAVAVAKQAAIELAVKKAQEEELKQQELALKEAAREERNRLDRERYFRLKAEQEAIIEAKRKADALLADEIAAQATGAFLASKSGQRPTRTRSHSPSQTLESGNDENDEDGDDDASVESRISIIEDGAAQPQSGEQPESEDEPQRADTLETPQEPETEPFQDPTDPKDEEQDI